MALISDPGLDVASWEADDFTLDSPVDGLLSLAWEPDYFITGGDAVDPNLPEGVLVGIGEAFLDDPGTPDGTPTEQSAPTDGFDALPLLGVAITTYDMELEVAESVIQGFAAIAAYYYYPNSES